MRQYKKRKNHVYRCLRAKIFTHTGKYMEKNFLEKRKIYLYDIFSFFFFFLTILFTYTYFPFYN